MGFWDEDSGAIIGTRLSKRRDINKFGISPSKHEGRNGRLYIPAHVKAKVGQLVRYIILPEGVAFRISDTGEYKVGILNAGSAILFAQAPYEMCRFATERVISIEAHDFKGGWLMPFDQFEKKGA